MYISVCILFLFYYFIRIVLCQNGFLSSPISVAAGMSCYNNQMVMSSTCLQPNCEFDGITCVNEYYSPSSECTSFFTTCTNGVLSTPIPVGSGKACLHGQAVLARDCIKIDDNLSCDFIGVKCSDHTGEIQ